MATFIFDGSRSITAAKADTVVITANPALFTNAADSGSDVVFSYSNGTSLTITGTNFGPNTNYPNVSLANGAFLTSTSATGTPGTPNDLVFAPGNTTTITPVDVSTGGTASGIKAVFGGLGISDPIDGPDSITIGGKGSFLIYGNGGNDQLLQSGAFDSTSFVTVFGGKGNDNIDLSVAGNSGAHMAVYGSENGTNGVDTISVVNTGASSATTIFGGIGAADPNDGKDSITFSGGGAVNIYTNAGDDTVNFSNGLDSTANFLVHLGLGNDTIIGNANGVKNTIQIYGDEGGDTINIGLGNGTNVIYGDTAAADSNGGADLIQLATGGTTTVYAAGGNDTIQLFGPAGGPASTDAVTIYGGNGADSIQIDAVSGYTAATGTISMTLGAGADTVNVAFNGAKGNAYSIEDFVPTSGGDKLIITTGTVQAQATVVTGTFQTQQQALDAAAQGGANSIAAVVYNGSTYVVVNNATPGFNPTTDLAIKLTGVTALSNVVTSVSGV